ncbi:MAG: hypothetical protein Q9170_001632 [Blastenia crenularia]
MEQGGSTSPLKSQIFEILVGSSAEPFYAHTDVLAKSEVLRQSVHGPWKEKSEARLHWPDWEPSAVEKFLEWMYTGDYTCPYPVKARNDESTEQSEVGGNEEGRQKSPSPAVDQVEGIDPVSMADVELPDVELPDEVQVVDDWDAAASTEDAKARTNTQLSTLPLAQIEVLSWRGCRALEKLSQAEEFDKWTGHQLWCPEELDYEATLLTHAKLYVMACFYGLGALKNMAWQRLRAVLVSIGKPKQDTTVIYDLVALIHYVYDKTGDISDDEEEPLRMLVSTFAALHFTNFQGLEVKQIMLSEEEGDREFVVDLMEKLA